MKGNEPLRVKICGITSGDDVRAAAEAGADAVGLNFVGGPRQIDVTVARTILESLPPMVTPVVLVRLTGGRLPPEVAKLVNDCRVSHVQVYGDVDAQSLDVLGKQGLRPLPVIAVAGPEFHQCDMASRRNVAAVVLDAFDPQRAGGTGQPFRWDWVVDARDRGLLNGWPPVILAGGLTPGNVADAVRVVRPYGVDVSSGVEFPGRPGRKDPSLMRAFVCAARSC